MAALPPRRDRKEVDSSRPEASDERRKRRALRLPWTRDDAPSVLFDQPRAAHHQLIEPQRVDHRDVG
jgi:hypothetical protein